MTTAAAEDLAPGTDTAQTTTGTAGSGKLCVHVFEGRRACHWPLLARKNKIKRDKKFVTVVRGS